MARGRFEYPECIWFVSELLSLVVEYSLPWVLRLKR